MDINEAINDFIYSDAYKSAQCLLDRLDSLITNEIGLERTNAEFGELDLDFLREVKDFSKSKASLYFGKTLRDLKCVISDENFSEHVIWIHYKGPKKLGIRDTNLPRSHIQDQVYRSIDEVVNIYKMYIGELWKYFNELHQIDLQCTVLEPVRPTFKEDYRKIQLADKIWLHVEVSTDGSAKNLSVLGQYDQRVLQELLQAWDHDKDIATNVLNIKCSLEGDGLPEMNEELVIPDCSICFCVELPGDTRVPQPLCHNSKCGAYFHRSCLYEYLVAWAGGRTPQFGIGKCPSCSQYIQCSDRDI